MNLGNIENLIKSLLIEIGENPDRPGLKQTPARVARMWRDFIEHDPGKLETTFESSNADQLIVVSGIKVWSMCEHHLVPFWADISIGYIPDGKVLGLSKFGRIAKKFAHRLQIQEQLVEQINAEVMRLSSSSDVAVIATGEHLCMTMRGVKTPAKMTSCSLKGRFKTDHAARAEFLSIVNK